MTKKIKKSEVTEVYPLFMSVELAARYCGIGENTLRRLMDEGAIEYLPIGNRKLLVAEALRDYYQRAKVPTKHEVSASRIA